MSVEIYTRIVKTAEIMKKSSDLKDPLTEGMDLTSHISYQVTIVSNLMAFGGVKDNQKRFGLTLRQWRIMGSISNLGPSTLGEISKTVYHDKSTLSRAARELEKKGIIHRIPNDKHKMSPRLAFTDKGQAFLDKIEPHFKEQAEQLTSALSKDEKKHLCTLLDKLKHHAAEVRALPGWE